MVDMGTLEKLFNELFSVWKEVKVVEVGPGDIVGYARALLEDGSTQMMSSPVKGQVAKKIEYRPQVLRRPMQAGVSVHIYGEEPITIPPGLIHRIDDIPRLIKHIEAVRKVRNG